MVTCHSVWAAMHGSHLAVTVTGGNVKLGTSVNSARNHHKPALPCALSVYEVELPRGILVLLSTNFALPWNPGVDPLAMPTSQILQRLYSLGTSSPDLSRYLYHLIQSDGEDPYLLGLQGSELTRLVDFLDRVRALPSASLRLTKQTPGPQRHPDRRRCFPTVFTQAASHLQPPRHPAIVARHCWRPRQSWRLPSRLWRLRRRMGGDAQ